jgi:hypothetical protein
MTLAHLAGAWKLLGMQLPSGWKVVETVGWACSALLGLSLRHPDVTKVTFLADN